MNVLNVVYLEFDNGDTPLASWLSSLDLTNKSKIQRRLLRLYDGNFGDYKKIDSEICELRFHFGSGYRIYFTITDKTIILLINGGDKSTQNKDIKKAKMILDNWRQKCKKKM